MDENFQYDVFLSHSSKDKEVVRQIATRLRGDGIKVWFDEWVLKPGDSIPAKIEEGLECSRVLVLCMSTNAFGSDWAQLESGTFRFRDPLNKERRFLPLRLDAASIKGPLAQFLYISWLPANREQEYAKLLEACQCPAIRPLTKTISKVLEAPNIPQFSDNEYGVVIAEIAENAGPAVSDDRTVTQILIDTIGDLLNLTPISKDRKVVVKPLGTAIPPMRGHEAALELAGRVKATLVIWGWYSRDERNSVIRVNIDLGDPDLITTPFVQNLDDPRVTPTNYVQQFGSILNWPRNDEVFNLAFTVSSVQEASASAALIVGFIAYTRGEYNQAKSLLTVLTQEGKRVSPLVRAYTYFLLGNIDLAQALPDLPNNGDMRRHAISKFIAANEYLDRSQDYSCILRAKIHNNIGAVLIALGDYDHANNFITESLRQSADNATAHVNMGRILLARAGYSHNNVVLSIEFLLDNEREVERRKWEAEGVASMKKALSINLNLLTPRMWLAKVAIQQNELKEATEQLKPLFAAFKKLDPQQVLLPDCAVIEFIHEFGPVFTADLVQQKDQERVLDILTAYLKEQERLVHMFSTMDPAAMEMAGHCAAEAKSAIARLKKENLQVGAPKGPTPTIQASSGFVMGFRKKVQDAISVGRSSEAIALLSKIIDEKGDTGARYTMGKLLFEVGNKRGAYGAISQAIEKEINDFTLPESTWSVKFADGERRATYSDYVDIIIQIISEQLEYESVVGNLIKRVHLLNAAQIKMILSPKEYTLPSEQKLDLFVNLGGNLAKESRFAEAADVFAEASHYAEGEQKLKMMMSELKMRSQASEPLETLSQLLNAVEDERSNGQFPPSLNWARFIDMKIGVWHCELAMRSGTGGDTFCRNALSNAMDSNKILTAYYGGQFALMRGDEAEWLKLLEEVSSKHQYYLNSPAFNKIEIGPREEKAVFEQMIRDLAAYYRRSGDFTKIGRLLFGEWECVGHRYHFFERQRVEWLQNVLLR